MKRAVSLHNASWSMPEAPSPLCSAITSIRAKPGSRIADWCRWFSSSLREAISKIRIHPDKHEVGLHFESSRKMNLERIQAFLPHQKALCHTLSEQVHVGPWGRSCTRLWYELPKVILTEETRLRLRGPLDRLIQVTLPILRQV